MLEIDGGGIIEAVVNAIKDAVKWMSDHFDGIYQNEDGTGGVSWSW